MRDVVFLVLVVAFFAIAFVFVRACELMLSSRSAPGQERGS